MNAPRCRSWGRSPIHRGPILFEVRQVGIDLPTGPRSGVLPSRGLLGQLGLDLDDRQGGPPTHPNRPTRPEALAG